MSYRDFHAAVRQVCEDEGWEVYGTYNDRGKTTRRLSYARNGWPVPAEMKANILEKVKKLVEDHRIDGEVYWFVATNPYRGPYDKLCVRVPI